MSAVSACNTSPIYDLPPEVFGQILSRGTDPATATIAFKKAFEQERWDWRAYQDWSSFYTLRALKIKRNPRSLGREEDLKVLALKKPAPEQIRELLKAKFKELKAAYPQLAGDVAKQIKEQRLPDRETFEVMQELIDLKKIVDRHQQLTIELAEKKELILKIVQKLKPILENYIVVDGHVNNFYTALFFIIPLLLATSLIGLIIGLTVAHSIGFLVATLALATYVLFCGASSLTLFAIYKLFLDQGNLWSKEFLRLEKSVGLVGDQR